MKFILFGGLKATAGFKWFILYLYSLPLSPPPAPPPLMKSGSLSEYLLKVYCLTHSHILFLSWSVFQDRPPAWNMFLVSVLQTACGTLQRALGIVLLQGVKMLAVVFQKKESPGWWPGVFNLVLRWVETCTEWRQEMWRDWRVWRASQWSPKAEQEVL